MIFFSILSVGGEYLKMKSDNLYVLSLHNLFSTLCKEHLIGKTMLGKMVWEQWNGTAILKAQQQRLLQLFRWKQLRQTND